MGFLFMIYIAAIKNKLIILSWSFLKVKVIRSVKSQFYG